MRADPEVGRNWFDLPELVQTHSNPGSRTMMPSRFMPFVYSLALLSLGACATVTRGTNEVYVIESNPPGAAVKLSNGLHCDNTPCSLKVRRKDEFVVTLSKEGYQSSTHNVATQVSGGGGAAMAGNVLVGGLIGVGVDAASGAMLEHKPNPLVVTLQPLQKAAQEELSLPEAQRDPASEVPAEAVPEPVA
jgi:hypothetical protein